MTDSTEQLRKVKSIFERAIDLESAADRDAFLNEACAGLDDLRAEVESLLTQHDAAEDFLDTPAALPDEFDSSALSETDALAWLPDDRMIDGRYHVDGVIAIGGMGVVYEATQKQPKRKVALKVMRRGLVSRAVRRRFQYEAETLARLHHPHIAQVYDAGVHYLESVRENGDAMPYFAMEFVEGAQTITEYAKSNDLSTDERIRLLMDACRAIQHGHQRGIIHRDIKPANILVDAQGCVKVIDFGVARITDADVAVTTMQTGVGEIVGTVQYMSPEQCAGNPHEIDVRSDVYSLGLVLYELLTNELPYSLSGMSIVRAVKAVQEMMPQRLSSINRRLRGDVEVIVDHALAKDPASRYQSVSELCDDLLSYVSGRPIRARKPSLWMRATAWMGRHPFLTTSVGSVSIATLILGATAAILWYGMRRPFGFRFHEDGRSAELISRFGNSLASFGSTSATSGSNVLADLIAFPDRLGGGEVVLYCVDEGDRSTDGQLWVCRPDDLQNPIWQTRQQNSLMPPDVPEALGVIETRELIFDVASFTVAQIFPNTPEKEVAVVHTSDSSSPNAIRIYDLSGNVLFESWHLGYIRAIHWWADEQILVCSADRHGRPDISQYGYPKDPPPYPDVLFAIRPERGLKLGWMNEPGWPEAWRSDPRIPGFLKWYKAVGPRALTDDFSGTQIYARGQRALLVRFESQQHDSTFGIEIDPNGRLLDMYLDDEFEQDHHIAHVEPYLTDWPPPVEDDEDQ